MQDAEGKDVPPVPGSDLDSWARAMSVDRPTLKVDYIGAGVTEIQIKLPGYAEAIVPVQFAPGKKITQELTFTAE
jgi:hypothetical protein